MAERFDIGGDEMFAAAVGSAIGGALGLAAGGLVAGPLAANVGATLVSGLGSMLVGAAAASASGRGSYSSIQGLGSGLGSGIGTLAGRVIKSTVERGVRVYSTPWGVFAGAGCAAVGALASQYFQTVPCVDLDRPVLDFPDALRPFKMPDRAALVNDPITYPPAQFLFPACLIEFNKDVRDLIREEWVSLGVNEPNPKVPKLDLEDLRYEIAADSLQGQSNTADARSKKGEDLNLILKNLVEVDNLVTTSIKGNDELIKKGFDRIAVAVQHISRDAQKDPRHEQENTDEATWMLTYLGTAVENCTDEVRKLQYASATSADQIRRATRELEPERSPLSG